MTAQPEPTAPLQVPRLDRRPYRNREELEPADTRTRAQLVAGTVAPSRSRPRPVGAAAEPWPELDLPSDAVARTYQVVGPADARPIVFIHGTRVTRAIWRPQQVGLADTFRVVTLDLPGHGSAAGRRFRLADAVDHVAEIIDEAAGGRALVVGLSLGGYVAMDLGARHPDRVAGLVLCGASSEPWAVVPQPLRIAAQAMLGLEDGVPQRWSRCLVGPLRALRSREWRAAQRVRFDVGGQALLEIAGRRFRPRLAAYPGRSLIMNGAHDPLFRRQETAFLGSARNGSLLVLSGAGHLMNSDVPEVFNRAIRRFALSLDW